MIGKVEQRREARRAEIVTTAWELARRDGVGGISLHALAKELGIRQPSLYAHFESKHALYDAMFADGNRRLLERLDAVDLPDDPRAAVKASVRAFIEFALEDPARYELLLHRPIPGFEPSPAAYAPAQAVLQNTVELLRRAGLDEQGDIDCVVAMVAGLIEAQSSNEPGGDRWTRHLERLADLYLDELPRRRVR